MKKKLLIIKCSKQSTWGSCKVISPNLVTTYEKCKDSFEIEYFDLPETFARDDAEKNEGRIIDLVAKIKTFVPDELVFIDHLPHPAKIIASMFFFLEPKDFPPFVFHIYGDFTYFARDWFLINDQFKNHKIKFIVASEAQRRLVNFFLNEGQVGARKFHFPVNEKEYYFDNEERVSFRKKLGISDEESIILYAGRISLQKNVDILVTEFERIVRESPRPVSLWIVGAFDDMGANFMGVKHHEGYMHYKIQKIVDRLPPEVSSRIKFWGIQKQEELRKIKAAADLYISLSLYHDEDYGMSPAEALAVGMPTLLTNWGGYYSFESSKWNCELVPVEITEYGHKIKTAKIHEFCQKHLTSPPTPQKRAEYSKVFLEEFSTTASSKSLKNIYQEEYHPFKGFHWNLIHYCNLYWTVKPGEELNLEMSPGADNFYSQVYRHYIKQLD